MELFDESLTKKGIRERIIKEGVNLEGEALNTRVNQEFMDSDFFPGSRKGGRRFSPETIQEIRKYTAGKIDKMAAESNRVDGALFTLHHKNGPNAGRA